MWTHSHLFLTVIFFSFFSDLTPGTVPLQIYSGDLMVGETSVTYHTDMEEISRLLANAANPVQFMCQVMASKQLLWKPAFSETRQVEMRKSTSMK